MVESNDKLPMHVAMNLDNTKDEEEGDQQLDIVKSEIPKPKKKKKKRK